jgi:hypothetical protein
VLPVRSSNQQQPRRLVGALRAALMLAGFAWLPGVQ